MSRILRPIGALAMSKRIFMLQFYLLPDSFYPAATDVRLPTNELTEHRPPDAADFMFLTLHATSRRGGFEPVDVHYLQR